jgi:hypothetical protein
MWLGEVVHKAIKYSIQHRKELDKEFVIASLGRRLARDYSVSRSFTIKTAKAKDFWLFEHYRNAEIDFDALVEKGTACIRNFFDSGIYQELLEVEDSQILYLDEGDIERMKFPMEGFNIYAIPDLCYRNAGGIIRLVDWKTGRVPEGELTPQLQVYALRLSIMDQLDPDKNEIHAHAVYLHDGIEKGRRVGMEDLGLIRTKARQSISEMQCCLQDIPANSPKDVTHFPKTEHSKKCKSCVYQEVCEGDQF